MFEGKYQGRRNTFSLVNQWPKDEVMLISHQARKLSEESRPLQRGIGVRAIRKMQATCDSAQGAAEERSGATGAIRDIPMRSKHLMGQRRAGRGGRGGCA